MAISLVGIKKRKSEESVPTEPVQTEIKEASPPLQTKGKQAEKSKTTISLVGLKKSKPDAIAPTEAKEASPVVEKGVTPSGKSQAATSFVGLKKRKPDAIAPVETVTAETKEISPIAGEPIKEAKQPKKELFFQAIGLIKGLISKGEDGNYIVTFEGQDWKLFGKKRILNRIPEKIMFLTVYPMLFNGTVFGFQVVAYNEKRPEGLRVNRFTLRGIWQFIPQFKRPIITVYRNEKRGDWDKCKPLHIPILWKDAPVEPFRFRSDLQEDEPKPERYFVGVNARFIPDKGFGFESLAEDPTKKVPKYLKKQVKEDPTNKKLSD
jgi:hypothetical protein